jgi:aquaporin rerated protein, other eukaryote
MVNVWIFFRISGGLFNPVSFQSPTYRYLSNKPQAVTLAMLMVQSIGFLRAMLLVAAQIAGSIFSSYIVKVLFPASFNVRTTLSEQTSLVQGVFIEAILTGELVFTIFMLAKEKHRATFMAPIGIGIALFVAELVGVYYTGGVSLDPSPNHPSAYPNEISVPQPRPLLWSLRRHRRLRQRPLGVLGGPKRRRSRLRRLLQVHQNA